jgi:hypothetical protein
MQENGSATVTGVSHEAQLMYAVLEENGPQVTKFFQVNRPLKDGRWWRWSRADYPTKPRLELEREGLIRPQRKQHGAARVYEITPPAQVAAQKKRYASQRVKASKQLGRPVEGLSARIAEYRRIERQINKDKGPLTSRGMWIQERRRVVELCQRLRRISTEGMVFWKAVPSDELAWVYEEVLTLRTWADDVLNSCDLMRGDEETRALIIKLRNTNGRPPAEIVLFNAKADELERGLLT